MKTITALITGGQTLAPQTWNLILDPNPVSGEKPKQAINFKTDGK